MDINVNDMLKSEITKINHTLLPPGFVGDFRLRNRVVESLSRIIDALGVKSSSAQGLNKVITSSQKLLKSSQDTIYLLKDAMAKGGRGEVIGMLRVGRKQLYLYDEREMMRKCEPLCVLDFYVRDDLQRHGHGRRLFDYMLKEEGVRACDLAIDGPSPKMINFMRRNYSIEKLIRQSNNFAVSNEFFAGTNHFSESERSSPLPTPAVGRFTAHKPQSSIANIIHGDGGAAYFPEPTSIRTYSAEKFSYSPSNSKAL